MGSSNHLQARRIAVQNDAGGHPWKQNARSCVLYKEMTMDDLFKLPDFDDDEPDVEAHSADPAIAADDEPEDDVEAHGQSSFR